MITIRPRSGTRRTYTVRPIVRAPRSGPLRAWSRAARAVHV